MSVTSVLPGLPPSYGPLSGNNSQAAKFAGLAEQSRQTTTAKAAGSQGTSIRVNAATQDIAVAKAGKGIQSAPAQALRTDGATDRRWTSGISGSGGSQASIGTALYRLISQMGNKDHSTSALLESWNSIMQGGQFAGEAGASTSRALLQNEMPEFESSSLHLTA
jgi:hypothetical protein